MIQHPLKVAREARGWSQARVAEQLGISTRTVSRWEQGQALPYPYYREQLSQLFDLSPQQLALVPEGEDATPSPTPLASSSSSVRDPLLPQGFGRMGTLLGRQELLAQFKRRLLGGENLAVTALQGLPGVGKTALAVALSLDEEVQTHFRDGILWAGLGPQPDVLGLLTRWGKLLNIQPAEVQDVTQSSSWSRVVRATIGARRMLLVIDDAWRAEQALALQVGGPNCAHLLTTRFPQVGFAFAERGVVEVPELSEEAGLALLSRYVPRLVELYPQETRMLVRAVGGLPLALTLMGKTLAAQAFSGQPRRLQRALVQLQDAQHRLQTRVSAAPDEQVPHLPLDTPLSLQAAISSSAQRLSPAGHRALAALAIFPAKPETFSEEAALAVLDGPADLLDELWDSGLLESSGVRRYSLHQTIADYARALPQDPEVGPRLVSFMVSWLQEHQRDYDQLAEEASIVQTALEQAARREMQADLLAGVLAFVPFLRVRGRYEQAEQYLERGWQAAISLQNEIGQLAILRQQAAIAVARSQYERAEEYGQQGLRLACDMSDLDAQSDLLCTLGQVAYLRGEHELTMAYYEESLRLARQVGNTERVCQLLANLGRSVAQHRQGSSEQARAYYQEGLALARQHNYSELVSRLLTYLGGLFITLGQYQQAIPYLQEGLVVAQQIGHRDIQGNLLNNLGAVFDSLGDFEQGMRYFQESLALARQIGSPEHICVNLGNLGVATFLKGDVTQSINYLQESVQIARELKLHRYLTMFLPNLGRSVGWQGAYEQANQYFAEALQLAQHLQLAYRVCITLSHWGEVHLFHGQLAAAKNAFEEVLSYDIVAKYPEYMGQALYGQARIAALQNDVCEARRLGEQSLAVLEGIGHYRAHEVRTWLATLQPASPL